MVDQGLVGQGKRAIHPMIDLERGGAEEEGQWLAMAMADEGQRSHLDEN